MWLLIQVGKSGPYHYEILFTIKSVYDHNTIVVQRHSSEKMMSVSVTLFELEIHLTFSQIESVLVPQTHTVASIENWELANWY